MPGPPPKFDPVRRNARSGPLRLPAEGRKGPVPAWPLSEPLNAAEAGVWRSLWATPQAVAWERLGCVRVVARYARVAAAAEERDASPNLLAQAATLEDRLGLTPKSMRGLLWEIVSDEVAERRAVSSTRRRVKAVD